jgi:hypothetical protein
MAAKINALPLKGKSDAPARPRGSSAQLRQGYTPDMSSSNGNGTAAANIAAVAGGKSTINSMPSPKGR